MKFVAALYIIFSSLAFAVDFEVESKRSELKAAVLYFSDGKYLSTIDELKALEAKSPPPGKELKGLISYWKGICYNRVQEFQDAILSFDEAVSLDYIPSDLHYEYGQALFASEKLVEARLQFKESIKRKYKRAVSLYYLGYISKELGEKNKAYTFFNAIQKLPESERQEVSQAAEMQIGDLYLTEAEQHKKSLEEVETTVIPQYRKALEINPEGELSSVILEKIGTLQRKYDLYLFQLRNGRPTQIPPYFLRLAQEFGKDTNVLFSPAETTITKSRRESIFSRTEAFGRYTFYIDDIVSVSPEFRAVNMYYFNRVPEVYKNDNYLLAPAFRTSYEHSYKKKPASFLLDYEYSESRRDVNGEKDLEFNSRTHAVVLGERLTLFNGGESTLRFRYRAMESYLENSDSKIMSLIFDDVRNFASSTMVFLVSRDWMRIENSIYDTDSWTFRGDFIFSRFKDWFTPSIGLGLTLTDPINARSVRGQELLINPTFRLSKFIKKNWRANLKADHQNNKSKDEANFSYKKNIFSLELEYFF
jgi:tetratricopeptide (TPR) repeat protein